MDFFVRNKGKIIALIVSIVLIVVIATTAGRFGYVSKIESFLGDFLAPANKTFYSIGNGISNTFSNISSYFSLKDENEKLKLRISELEYQNLIYEKTIAREEYLKNEFKLEQKINYDYIKAEIIGKNPGNWFSVFTINKGKKDGVAENQTVISAIQTDTGIVKEGIVGKVIEIGDNWAKIESIIDEQNSISFNVSKSMDGGVISGNNFSGELEGYMFDDKSILSVGDRVLSSGLGGVYQEDILIGYLTEVKMSDDNLVKEVKVKPAVDFKKIDRVFVLTGQVNE